MVRSKTHKIALAMTMLIILLTNRAHLPQAAARQAPIGGEARHSTWARLTPGQLPSARLKSSLTLNPLNQVAILFGGLSADTFSPLNDLWLTDGAAWIPLHTAHTPSIRSSAAMAYDERAQGALLFGGINIADLDEDNNIAAPFNDTWFFDGVDWAEQFPLVSPAPRFAASMTYDPERQVTVLFGGQMNRQYWPEFSNETWLWNGANWQQQFPANSPPARADAQMIYDRARNTILLFGGRSSAYLHNDTWLWDGTDWIEMSPAHIPPGRAEFGMAYHESRQQVILFGGQQSHPYENWSQTWAWNGQDWSLLPAWQAPPPDLAFYAQLVYLPQIQGVLLFNAYRPKWQPSSSEAWLLHDVQLVFMPLVGR